MKYSYIVRHAKSSWAEWGLSDHDRPLNDRGKRDAPHMAEKLFDKSGGIDSYLCSSARRARDTFSFFREPLRLDQGMIVPELYHASPRTIISVIRQSPDNVSSVILFAHNPGLTELHNMFSKDFLDNLPTCGIFRMVSRIDSWTDLDVDNTTVDYLIYPKQW